MKHDDHTHYDNPLVARYATEEMSRLWGPERKFRTWRRLWVALAEAERELGLPIAEEQVAELKAHVDDIDFAAAEGYERRLRHDVMAHVHAYGDVCPKARAIIHLGATSCYVTDNTDLLLMRESLDMVAGRLAAVIDRLASFAVRHRATACLGFTHFQPAQPTTVGKRAALWAYDLVGDLESIEFRRGRLKARGVKGTTGTQASFLELFKGDHAQVRRLDELVAHKIGFEASYVVTGQTYSRRIDSEILSCLSGVAQSAHKLATDLRLLQGLKEIEEPFESEQIGSSAMAYKRNPMRAERICALARFVMSLETSATQTAATQWLERTLDDSANRRLTLPQAFLAIDSILATLQNVVEGLVVNTGVIARRLDAELPFMATEAILMAGVERGGDRQTLHEQIRRHSQAAASTVKEHGLPNDLIERLKGDAHFAAVDLDEALDPARFVGRAPEQVDDFVAEVVEPIRRRHADHLRMRGEVRV